MSPFLDQIIIGPECSQFVFDYFLLTGGWRVRGKERAGRRPPFDRYEPLSDLWEDDLCEEDL